MWETKQNPPLCRAGTHPLCRVVLYGGRNLSQVCPGNVVFTANEASGMRCVQEQSGASRETAGKHPEPLGGLRGVLAVVTWVLSPVT